VRRPPAGIERTEDNIMRGRKIWIAAVLLCAVGAATAAPDGDRAGHVGMGAGAAAGALVGGPPGAIVGAGLGAFLGDRAARADDAERLAEEAAAAAAEAERLSERLAATQATLTERELALAELERRQALTRELELEVLFRTDSSVLPEEYATRIRRLAALLRAQPGLGVRLDGHADARGDAARNEALSAARAGAVRAALVAEGVAPARIAADHHGARAARAPADDPDAQALDRRVVIRLAPGQTRERVAGANGPRH
jgi:outer membrane protein OmpA-like peptidoglycan-associated protein